MGDKYILDDAGEPVAVDLMTWARWFDSDDKRRVNLTQIQDDPDIHVSTVFLGLDHSFGSGPPVLWETMIFGGDHDQAQWRYESRADAERGHEHACKVARGEAML